MKNIVFLQTTLGHYHFSRMEYLNKECHKKGIEFLNIELAGHQISNLWVKEENQVTFNNITLFPEQDISNLSTKKIWNLLKKTLIRLEPSVIFIVGYSENIMRKAKIFSERNKFATVVISDSNEFDKKRYWLIELLKRKYVSRFDAAFVGGTNSRNYIKKLGIPENRISLGCDAIDNHFFSSRSKERKDYLINVQNNWGLPKNYFLFVGRLIKQKNLFTLLNAYNLYFTESKNESDPWKLVICGDGPEINNLQKFINQFPSDMIRNILFYGYIKQPEIIDFFAKGSCLILPSYSETWGLVINEALACGIPVIVSSKVGCVQDLVKNGINGFIFNPNFVSELSQIMINFTKLDESKRYQMGNQGREIIQNWGLANFSNSVITCAQIAWNHKCNGK